MKITYTLKEFHSEVKKIANSIGKDYISVYVEMENDGKVLFKCYIADKGFHYGNTMEESIQKLRDKVFPQADKDIDVEIEIDNPTENIIKDENYDKFDY